MATVNSSAAALRIAGDTLDPDAIALALGHQATSSQSKGQSIVGGHPRTVRIAKTGHWRLAAKDRSPANLDAQIDEILSCLSSDLSVWAGLRAVYKIDLFCGLFMDANEGLTILPSSLTALGSRGIELDLDIYGAGKQAEPWPRSASDRLGR